MHPPHLQSSDLSSIFHADPLSPDVESASFSSFRILQIELSDWLSGSVSEGFTWLIAVSDCT